MTAIEHDRYGWDPFRPLEVAQLLAGVAAPWYVAAGWALDLFLGGQRREHEDLEIAIPAARFGELEASLRGLELFVVGPEPGLVRPLSAAGELLASTHQTWVLDPDAGVWRFDVFREPSDGGTWISRRDDRIRLAYEHVIEWNEERIPYGRPEIVLLYKAKHARPKDDDDFAAVLPSLEPARRQWLADALELVHPGHRWVGELR